MNVHIHVHYISKKLSTKETYKLSLTEVKENCRHIPSQQLQPIIQFHKSNCLLLQNVSEKLTR